MNAIALYKNMATREVYELSYEVRKGETSLSMAWSLVDSVAALKGWNRSDILVTNIFANVRLH